MVKSWQYDWMSEKVTEGYILCKTIGTIFNIFAYTVMIKKKFNFFKRSLSWTSPPSRPLYSLYITDATCLISFPDWKEFYSVLYPWSYAQCLNTW